MAPGNTPAHARTPVKDSSQAKLDSDLREITRLLQRKEIAAAEARLSLLAARSWPVSEARRIEQHAALVDAVRNFWRNLESALDTVSAGRSIHLRGNESPIVEVSPTSVVIRTAGRHLRLQRDRLPEDAVRALSEGLLDLDDPRNQIHYGAYLYVTDPTNGAVARSWWEGAARAGEDVSRLLQLLP